MSFDFRVPSALSSNSSITQLQIEDVSKGHREIAVKTMFVLLEAFMDLPRLPCLKMPKCQRQVKMGDQRIETMDEDNDLLTCCRRIVRPTVLKQIENFSTDLATKARVARIWISRNEKDELFLRECLDLSDARLKAAPLFLLSKFHHLIKLDLAKNSLTVIPDEFFDLLPHLQLLSLSSNRLRHLPNTIGKMTEMRRFFVHFNELEELPEEMEKMKNLTKVGLWHNKISIFPLCLTRLERLTELDLTDNRIEEIPDGIGPMTSLRSLGLEGNPIKKFSTELYTKLVNPQRCRELWIDKGETHEAYLRMVAIYVFDHSQTEEKANKVPVDVGSTSSQTSSSAPSISSGSTSSQVSNVRS